MQTDLVRKGTMGTELARKGFGECEVENQSGAGVKSSRGPGRSRKVQEECQPGVATPYGGVSPQN